MYKKHLLLLAASATLLFSCQKDDSLNPEENNTKIIGTWTFVNMTAHTNATETATIDGDTYKSVTISDYTSTNNAGEITISAGTFSTKDFTYTANTYAHVTTYVNGTLEDTLSQPIQFTAPVGSSNAPYKLIGSDSMYLSVGTVTTGTTTVPSTPAGFKYAWSGDTLLVTSIAVVPAGASYVGYSKQTMRYLRK